MPSNPGDEVIDFVMLHMALHDRPKEGDDRPDGERLSESYHQAAKNLTDLAAADLDLCLTLLADLAGHFAITLGKQAGHRAIGEVLEDWAGRGWTPRVHRAGTITPTVLVPATQPDPLPASVEQRWPAGAAPPF